MLHEFKNDLMPKGYIRWLFKNTKDGKIEIPYCDSFGNPETRTVRVEWTEADMEAIVDRYNVLTSSLRRIARVHDELDDEENRKKLLSEADLKVWNVYVRLYEPMNVNWDELFPIPPCEPDELMSLIRDIHERSIYGDLIEEEKLLWDKYCRWQEEQSQKRIPFSRRSSADMIEKAFEYERLISFNAPESVITEAGRHLAEEMVIYYAGEEDIPVWD